MTDTAYAGNRIRLMNPVINNRELIRKAAAVLPLAAFLLSLFVLSSPVLLPSSKAGLAAGTSIGGPAPEYSPPKAVSAAEWGAFMSREGAEPPQTGSLARKYRLAGTFVPLAESSARKAILDDLDSSEQYILSENEPLGDARLIKIFKNRVVLRNSAGEHELWLSFSDRPGAGDNKGETADMSPEPNEDPLKLTPDDSNPFGRRQIGKNRWVFSRDKLTGYYDELRDHPKRLLAVFDSMKPVYNQDSQIEGYYLEIEGEENFFNATGLAQGDIVRKVNGVPMTNRRRAEHFISQFVENNANAFVLEVQRDAGVEKLIYQIR